MWIDKTAKRSLVGTWRGSERGAIITYTHSCDGEGRNCRALAAAKAKEAKIHPATFSYFCHAGTKFKRSGF
jgi:hypothetical protein